MSTFRDNSANVYLNRKVMRNGTLLSNTQNAYWQHFYATYGDNHKDWLDKIRNLRDATTLLTGVVQKTTMDSGVVRYKSGTYNYVETGKLLPWTVWNPPVLTGNSILEGVDNEAKVRFLDKLVAWQQAFEGGTFAGELKETVGMLRKPCSALREGFTKYLTALKKKRRKVKTLDQATDVITGTYLEYVFGWTPLINDIEDLIDAVAILQDEVVSKRFTAQASDTRRSMTKDQIFVHYVTRIRSIYRESVSTEYFVKYYGVGDASLINSSSPSRLGLNLRSFIPTVWNLLPYSWAVDYFANIGDIVTATSYGRSGLAWSARAAGIEESRLRVTTNVLSTSGAWQVLDWSPTTIVGQNKSIERNSYSGSFIPTLSFEIPTSVKKWVNLTAVGLQHRKLIPYFKP